MFNSKLIFYFIYNFNTYRQEYNYMSSNRHLCVVFGCKRCLLIHIKYIESSLLITFGNNFGLKILVAHRNIGETFASCIAVYLLL